MMVLLKGGFMMCAVDMDSGGMIYSYVPSSMTIGSGI
jgi:hypothetical protein